MPQTKTKYLPPEIISKYVNLGVSFSDYPYFEDNVSERTAQKVRFVKGYDYVPRYRYPKLDTLDNEVTPGETVAEKRGNCMKRSSNLRQTVTQG